MEINLDYNNIDFKDKIINLPKGLKIVNIYGDNINISTLCDILENVKSNVEIKSNRQKEIDDEFLKSVREKSEYIKKYLMNIKGVKSVSGMGLMLGVEIEKDAKEVANECLENGLLVLTAKTKVRLLPALNISFCELERGLKILKEVIEK